MADMRRTVTVTGVGAALVPPDRALASLAAETRGGEPGAALSACVTATSAMVQAALAAGVARPAVQTSGLTLQPWWARESGSPQLVGYQASNSLSVRIDRLDEIGSLLTAMVAAGGEAARVNGVSLVVGDPEAGLRSAREAAFADALAKAEQYAELAGVALGVLLSVEERSHGRYRAMSARGYAPAMPADMGVEPGENQLTVDLTAGWELLPEES